jgi:hypothetical protein
MESISSNFAASTLLFLNVDLYEFPTDQIPGLKLSTKAVCPVREESNRIGDR